MRLRHSALLLTAGLLAAVVGLTAFADRRQVVEAAEVERGDLELVIRLTGEVINDRSVSLTALVDGQISRIYTTRGARVKASQVLASMDNRAAAARQQRARALLRQEEVRRREEHIGYQRLKKLADKQAVSREALEEAKLHWDAANAAWEVARAELRIVEVEQEWQQVRAPFDAVVVDKSTEVGQWVEAGTQLFSLAALEGWEIEAHVDAVDSGRVRLGQPVTIRCDAFPDRVWRSRIDWIGPSVEREKDNRLNTFRVRLPLGDEAPPLLLGQNVDLEIHVDHRQQVLKLPFAALRERDGKFEAALIEAGEVRYREVEIGLEGETHVEVVNGLAEGQQVVRLDGEPLETGAKVRYGAVL